MNKRRKVVKYRGSKTHGGGSMKKRRGAGHRGGRGQAGSGKRADQKKPSLWKTKSRRGKFGFTSLKKVRSKATAINLSELQRALGRWVVEGKVQVSGGVYAVDLGALGYDKLLGAGSLGVKAKVVVAAASAKAVEKVAAAGGSVEGLVQESVSSE
ncbi:MAG: 50S ribosomal protein L15 [Nitrosarchaeum sp.]|nr:50S ribosomal protein L15 [Nitrosarchaeum sp.]